eukprot:GHVL01016177.1.p1 GENE.GHVL01016177.1~~GHVL01016177.1.p1  ORF type:complete len:215 (-),score=38.44 GHVL01016177.1:208-852(-)
MWKKHHDRALSVCQQASDSVNEWRQSSAAPELESKIISQISLLDQEILTLEQSLIASSENPVAHNVNQQEIQARGKDIVELQRRRENIQSKYEYQNKNKRSMTNFDYSPVFEDNKYEVDFWSSQESLINEQDEQLDFLHGTVQNLKHIGHSINEEIDLHCRLLSNMENATDTTSNKLVVNEVLLKKMMKKRSCSSTILLSLTIVLLLIIIIAIY